MQSNIRKWGNSAGTIIPASILVEAGLSVGDQVNIEVIDGSIVIKHMAPTYKLDDLLAASPDDSWALDQDDEAWLDDKPQGSEEL